MLATSFVSYPRQSANMLHHRVQGNETVEFTDLEMDTGRFADIGKGASKGVDNRVDVVQAGNDTLLVALVEENWRVTRRVHGKVISRVIEKGGRGVCVGRARSKQVIVFGVRDHAVSVVGSDTQTILAGELFKVEDEGRVFVGGDSKGGKSKNVC